MISCSWDFHFYLKKRIAICMRSISLKKQFALCMRSNRHFSRKRRLDTRRKSNRSNTPNIGNRHIEKAR
jgi:hypothetical protein